MISGDISTHNAPQFLVAVLKWPSSCLSDNQHALLFIVQCTTTRSSTGTSSPPTCCWGTMATSRSQTLVWATSLRGRTPSCRARRGRRPSWPPRWWPNTSIASAGRWERNFSCWPPGKQTMEATGSHFVLDVSHHVTLCLIWWAMMFEKGPMASWKLFSSDIITVCWPGIRHMGDGSHTLLFCLWEAKKAHSISNKKPVWHLVWTV